jgi:ABC-2 type transport system permease protein/oleandomycin transport system permease protein
MTTAVAADPWVTTAEELEQRTGPRWLVADSLVMTARLLRQIPRIPELLIFSIIQPIMFVVLFVYVFGGAIRTPGGIPYVQFLLPGVFVQTVAFGGAATGIGMADDLQKGLVDRFRSLPMARAALLLGRTTSDVVRNALTVVVMIAVGMATGFRFHGSALGVIAGLALLLLFEFALSWIGVLIGLAVKSVEAAQSGGFIWLFPLTFASSAFVPVESMPSWLRGFATHQPVTVTVNALRGWFNGEPVGSTAWQALGWIAGVLVIAVPVAVTRYRRMTR